MPKRWIENEGSFTRERFWRFTNASTAKTHFNWQGDTKRLDFYKIVTYNACNILLSLYIADIAEDYQLKQHLSEVDSILKTAALANQKEHKSIVVKHNLISQGFGNSQTIKERLTSLAERQRMLLTCFKRQTELKEKIKCLNAKTLTSSTSESGEKVIAVTQPTLTNKIHSDLAQPVPLDRLIKENILKPNESVSCSLMVSGLL